MATKQMIPTQNPILNAMIPPVPPPPSPALGFQVWASDPQNAMKVAHSMTEPNAPLQPNAPSAAVNPPQPKPMASVNPPQLMASAKPPVIFGSQAPMIQPAAVGAPPSDPAIPSGAMPAVPAAVMPPVQSGAQAKLNADQAQLDALRTQGAGLNKTKNPILRGFERAGDIALPFLIGRGAMAIPGTTAHNLWLQQQQRGVVADDQNAVNNLQNQQVTDANLALTRAKTDEIPIDEQFKEQKAQGALAQHGLMLQANPDGSTSVVPDTNSPIYKKQQAAAAYVQAGIELRQAQAQLQRLQQEKFDPNSPIFKQAQQKLNTAQQNAADAHTRAEAYWLNATAGNLGVDTHGNPIAGANITADGRPVGSRFAANVRPTGTERNKADMADSADEQLNDIVAIMQRHPQLFGPGYGQTTEFKKWLGAQGPDAQKFATARTIAGDHLAATFGGRSEAALDALDKAIGNYKDNPQAAIAGISQLQKATKVFQKAGHFKTVGGAPGSGNNMMPPGGVQTFTDGGKTYRIPASQVSAFKRDHPNAR